MSLPLSIVILTLNEERNLPQCLASVRACDDIVVLDSGSTDRTHDIARAAGARVAVNPFRDFAQQRNFALTAIPFRHPWVFHLDADELMTSALAAECAALPDDGVLDGYFVAPHMMFEGVWLRRCTDYPAWQARCVHRERFRFVQAGHGQREAPGMRMGFLQHSYLHDISIGDIVVWERKHRRYAREEAEEFLRSEVNQPPRRLAPLFRGTKLERRRALKRLSYGLPFRPVLRFVYQYLLRGGIADGRKAWRYCRLLARYERFAVEELRTLRARLR